MFDTDNQFTSSLKIPSALVYHGLAPGRKMKKPWPSPRSTTGDRLGFFCGGSFAPGCYKICTRVEAAGEAIENL